MARRGTKKKTYRLPATAILSGILLGVWFCSRRPDLFRLLRLPVKKILCFAPKRLAAEKKWVILHEKQ